MAEKKKTTNKKEPVKQKNTKKESVPKSENNEADKEKKLPQVKLEVAAICITGISIFMMISIYFGSGGAFGKMLSLSLKGLFGIGAYILPIAFVFGCIAVLFSDTKKVNFYKLLMSVFLFIFVISFVHLLTASSIFKAEGVQAYIKDKFIGGGFSNGGLVGALIGDSLSALLSTAGAFLVLVFGAACMTVLISERSLFSILKNISNKIGTMISFEKIEYTDDEENAEEYFEEYEDSEEFKENIKEELKKELKEELKSELTEKTEDKPKIKINMYDGSPKEENGENKNTAEKDDASPHDGEKTENLTETAVPEKVKKDKFVKKAKEISAKVFEGCKKALKNVKFAITSFFSGLASAFAKIKQSLAQRKRNMEQKKVEDVREPNFFDINKDSQKTERSKSVKIDFDDDSDTVAADIGEMDEMRRAIPDFIGDRSRVKVNEDGSVLIREGSGTFTETSTHRENMEPENEIGPFIDVRSNIRKAKSSAANETKMHNAARAMVRGSLEIDNTDHTIPMGSYEEDYIPPAPPDFIEQKTKASPVQDTQPIQKAPPASAAPAQAAPIRKYSDSAEERAKSMAKLRRAYAESNKPSIDYAEFGNGYGKRNDEKSIGRDIPVSTEYDDISEIEPAYGAELSDAAPYFQDIRPYSETSISVSEPTAPQAEPKGYDLSGHGIGEETDIPYGGNISVGDPFGLNDPYGFGSEMSGTNSDEFDVNSFISVHTESIADAFDDTEEFINEVGKIMADVIEPKKNGNREYRSSSYSITGKMPEEDIFNTSDVYSEPAAEAEAASDDDIYGYNSDIDECESVFPGNINVKDYSVQTSDFYDGFDIQGYDGHSRPQDIQEYDVQNHELDDEHDIQSYDSENPEFTDEPDIQGYDSKDSELDDDFDIQGYDSRNPELDDDFDIQGYDSQNPELDDLDIQEYEVADSEFTERFESFENPDAAAQNSLNLAKTDDAPPFEPDLPKHNRSVYVPPVHKPEIIVPSDEAFVPPTQKAQTEEKFDMRNYDYKFPSTDLLAKNPSIHSDRDEKMLMENAQKLINVLRTFKIEAQVQTISQGPTVTRYEITVAAGTKLSKISDLSDNIAYSLEAISVRIEAPIPGKSAVGIEIPNKDVKSVYLSEVVCSEKFRQFKAKTAFAIGKDITGNVVVEDIASMPHLLIAGATGAGKSVCINTLIMSIIYKSSPKDVRLIMVDPKVVELAAYEDIPHLLIPVVTDPEKASAALNWVVAEMMERYDMFKMTKTRNISGYNDIADKNDMDRMSHIVVIIDELADLMMVAKKEVESSICRIAQLARAAGIHLVIATQRPSTDVITGLIKANIPSRIAFKTSNGIDSRTILDSQGAEKLIGRGDMLLKTVKMSKALRIQCAFVSDDEVESIVNFVKENNPCVYDRKVIDAIESGEYSSSESSSASGGNDNSGDELTDDVLAFLVKKGKASTSSVQRAFHIGYNRAANIIEELEERGLVGPDNGSKGRDVLMDQYQYEEYLDRKNNY